MNSCYTECNYFNYQQEAFNIFRRAATDNDHLKNLNVWIDASNDDKTSIQMKNLYACVLKRLGANILEHDFDVILAEKVDYDVAIMFTITLGTSARALEIVASSEYTKSSVKDKLYIYMPNDYSDGYISNKLNRKLIGDQIYHKKAKLSFEQLDIDIFSKCIKHLIELVNDKRKEMELKFEPSILIATATELEFRTMAKLLENKRFDPALKDVQKQYPHSKIGGKNVVLAMTGIGNNFSSAIATKVLDHYKSINYIFMTGIAGGIPYLDKPDENVRLGDIVVCSDRGVVQYDRGKINNGKFEFTFLPRPSDATLYRNTVAHVNLKEKEPYGYWEKLDLLLTKDELQRPDKMDLCDTPWIEGSSIEVPPIPNGFDPNRPRIHFGVIASGNIVLKDVSNRDELKSEFKAKAVEMEGSGVADAAWLQNKFYFIVRGISDYCNPDKNDIWQPYAAAAAASFTYEIIEETLSDI